MLKIKNISKSYQQRGIVLNNLNLEVNERDCVSVMGPSGCGKTTLFNIIGLLDKPDSGEVIFRNEPVLKFNSDEAAIYRNRNIGFIFQDHHLLPYLTVYENIILPTIAVKQSADKKKLIETDALHMMELVGIKMLSAKYPSQISGGEAQRVAVIRALINKPSILLADEPTGSLDLKNGEILGTLLLQLNKEFGIAVIVATHSHEMAGKMDRRFKLEDGKLITMI